MKDEIAEFKRIIAEKQNDEEQVDVNSYAAGEADTAMSSKPPRPNSTLPELNVPLSSSAGKIIETEEAKILRYERVIDQLKKMVDNVRRQNKGTRGQFERELSCKTELEYYLKKAVDKVYKEKQKQLARDA